MHSLKEADMLAAKVDLLTNILENCEKISAQETVQAMDTHMTCEVCGETRLSGNFAPRPMETSTLSIMTTVFVLKIKDGISAPTTKVTITIIIRNVRIIKVMVILSLRILSIVKVE